MQTQISQTLKDGLHALKQGKFVLLHDSDSRENEIDMVIPAQYITPEAISLMRINAGGLICCSLGYDFAKNIGLSYMHDILFSSNSYDSSLKNMVYGITKYGDHPTFSISVNHIDTRTGITDVDRALTAKELASIHTQDRSAQKNYFVSTFRTPGHLPLLIAEKGLLQNRQGHTEMSIFLMRLAGLRPVSVICEMLDSNTHTALSMDSARSFAKTRRIPIIDAVEILSIKDYFPWSS